MSALCQKQTLRSIDYLVGEQLQRAPKSAGQVPLGKLFVKVPSQ